MRRFVAVLSVAALAGCTTPPSQIEAADVAPSEYTAFGCDHLAEEEARLSAELEVLVTKQDQAVTNDIVGVLFIAVPLGRLGGSLPRKEAIADHRGRIRAIQQTRAAKGCVAIAPAT